MAFYLNELSLHNQFHNVEQFTTSIRLILDCRELLRCYEYKLHCSRLTVSNRPVINNVTFRKVVGNLQDRNLQRIILRWIDQEGPFWDDNQIRAHGPDDYFSINADDIVTESALAEAAYLTLEGLNSAIISFKPSNYLSTPIIISWYKTTENKIDISLNNYWELIELKELLLTLIPPIQSWEQLKKRILNDFPNLVLLPGIENGWKGQPFNSTIALHIVQLLSILNEFKVCFNQSGERSERGHEIYENFFTGDMAKFTDESPSNKNKYQKELTFLDLDGKQIFCSFHGKIKHHQYRIHFSWPITKDGRLYIAYIGPKITKE